MSKTVQDAWLRWRLKHLFMRDLQDVDVTTTPPVHGDELVWDDTVHKWVPDAP